MEDCGKVMDLCRNKQAALHLKAAAIVSILCASALGVGIPLVGRKLKFLRTDGNFFFITKAFAAGVILATGFVHMLPDAEAALTSTCLPEHPWAKFPWHGFIAMMAALFTLLVDFVGTEYYEKKHGISSGKQIGDAGAASLVGSARIGSDDDMFTSDAVHNAGAGGEKVVDIESKAQLEEGNGTSRGNMHIVGMRAHAASHSHSHPGGQHGVEQPHRHATGHTHSHSDATAEEVSLRHVVISQVLELGIVAHSVIIGISLGVSESPCTIRPLIAALVFHQFFEGFALGGCISQAGFKYSSATLMAVFFAVTTPFGISLGIGISSSYNENSPHALIVEGVFDSVSAGILVYMALVDLIAADFLSKRLRCDRQLQLFSYMALFGGAGAMSALAVWA